MASAASRGEQPPPFSDEELKKAIKSVSIAGIVYCRSRESCEVVANSLRSKGLYARPFHKYAFYLFYFYSERKLLNFLSSFCFIINI